MTSSSILLDLQQLFHQHLVAQQKANATVVAYSSDIEQLISFVGKRGKSDANQVVSEDIDAFKDDLKRLRYSSKSVSRKLNSIKSFFRFVVAQGVLTANPAERIVHPKIDQTPPRVMSKIEYRALRDVVRGDSRIFAIVELLLQTGMRISELAELQMESLDFEHNTITIPAEAGRPARKVPLNAAARRALDDYLAVRPRTREKTVFLTKTCRPFLVRNIRTSLDRYFRIAGIREATVNDLRHTFIVEQLRAGTPLVYVSQLVGHKRITTTERYLQLVDAAELAPQIQLEEL